MKKIFLTLLAVGMTAGAVADTNLLAESDGWQKLTSISQTDITSHYYVFVDNDADLMLGLAASTQNGNHAAFYQTSVDPATDVSKVWSLEANGSDYAMRNLTQNGFVMQTEWSGSSNDLRWRINDQGAPCDWAGLGLAYADGAWTLTSTKYNRPLGVYNNGTDAPANGTEIGANNAGNGQKFQIYAIAKTDFATKLFAGASETNPKDCSGFIVNNSFNANNNPYANWTRTKEPKTYNGALEYWHNGAFTFSQTLSNLPNGKYRVGVQMVANYDGQGNTPTAWLYATGAQKQTASPTHGSASGKNFAEWNTEFNNDLSQHKVEVDATVANGTLTVGIEETTASTWIVFDNFQLAYLGEVVDVTELLNAYNGLLAQAREINGYMQATVETALSDAIGATVNQTDAQAIQTATQTLADAVNAAKASIAAYAELKANLDLYAVKTWYTPATDYGTAYAAAKAVYDGKTSDVAAVEAAAATIVRDDYRAYLRENVIKAYKTATAYVKWSTKGDGWEHPQVQNHGQKNNKVNKDIAANSIWENWNPSNITGDMKQTISNLPAGQYFLKMVAFSDHNSDDYIYIKSGDTESRAAVLGHDADNAFLNVTDPIEIANGTVEIGFHFCGNGRWGGIGAVELYAYSVDDLARTTAADAYGTLCLPYDFTSENATVYTVTGTNDKELVLTTVAEPKAGTPYLYQATTAAPAFQYEATANMVATPDNSGDYLKGTFTRIDAVEAGLYVLQTQDKGQAFYVVGSEDGDARPGLPAYRCYLSLPAASGVKAFFLGDTATAIDLLNATADGREAIYDLQGRRLAKLQKGINIVGGKKIIVK